MTNGEGQKGESGESGESVRGAEPRATNSKEKGGAPRRGDLDEHPGGVGEATKGEPKSTVEDDEASRPSVKSYVAFLENLRSPHSEPGGGGGGEGGGASAGGNVEVDRGVKGGDPFDPAEFETHDRRANEKKPVTCTGEEEEAGMIGQEGVPARESRGSRAPAPFDSAEFENHDCHAIRRKSAACTSKDEEAGMVEEGLPARESHGSRAPAPFDSAEFENHGRHAIRRKSAAFMGEEAGTIGQEGLRASKYSMRESKVVEVENRVIQNTSTRGPVEDTHPLSRLDDFDPENAADEEKSIAASDLARQSEVEVTQAYLIDAEVVYATPLRAEDNPAEVPYIWWKQPNAKRCLALTCLVATASAVALSVYFSKNDSEPDIQTANAAATITTSAPPSASMAPTAPPSTSSPTSSPTPSCITCNNIPTPWMIGKGYECATAPNWLIEANCTNDSFWVNNRYCEKRCQDDGYGYHSTRCCTPPTPSCITCSNVPTPWMVDKGYECATAANWLIEANCINDSFWVNNRYCEKRCQDDGYGYHGTRCCTSSDLGVYVSKNDSGSGIETATKAASIAASAPPSASTAPTAPPGISPSPTSSPPPSLTFSCIACTNIRTPWMIKNETECDTAPNWFVEANCVNDSFWVNNRFCEKRCQDDGYGYHGISCCPTPSCITCSNVPTPWMVGKKYECATAPNWLIEENCINDSLWVNNNFCEMRCQDDGYGYHSISCCTSSD